MQEMLRTLQDDIQDLKHEISILRSDLHDKKPAVASDSGGHNERTIEVSNNSLSRLE